MNRKELIIDTLIIALKNDESYSARNILNLNIAAIGGWKEIVFNTPNINGSTVKASFWVHPEEDQETTEDRKESIKNLIAANFWEFDDSVPDFVDNLISAKAFFDQALGKEFKLNLFFDDEETGFPMVQIVEKSYIPPSTLEIKSKPMPLAIVTGVLKILLKRE